MEQARSAKTVGLTEKPLMTDVIAGDGAALSKELLAMRETLFPPVSQKTLRSFSSVETAKLVGIAQTLSLKAGDLDSLTSQSPQA